MKRNAWRWILLVGFLFVWSTPGKLQPARAQSSEAPLVLLIKGDLWTWSGGKLQQRTTWGYNEAPILSPDGKTVAYKSTAQIAVDVLKREGGIGGGELPANIWLLDVATNNALRAADQPPGASMMTGNTPDKFLIRSTPTWSPDGKALAWTELNQEFGKSSLVVYTVATRTARTLVTDLPPYYGVPSSLPVRWGAGGLAVETVTQAKAGDVTVEGGLLVYDPNGKLLSSAKFGILMDFLWIRADTRDLLAVHGNDKAEKPYTVGKWLLLDPATGQVSDMPGVPELYSLAAPDGLTLFPASPALDTGWNIGLPGGGEVPLLADKKSVSGWVPFAAISPDGKQIAFSVQGKASIYSDGRVTQIVPDNAGGLAWTPLGWRVRAAAKG